MTATFAPDVRRALPVLLAQRLVLNAGGRMVFTYLPILSAGTGMSITALSRVIFARDLSGLLGPWIGAVVRRRGAWSTMVAAGLLASLGMALVLLGPIGVVVGIVLWGLCRTSFLVASNSWIGDVVAYERRGRASGLIELTWAAAALIGLPILGLVIGWLGWWAAPLLLSTLGGPIAFWARNTAVPEGGQGALSVDGPGSMSVQRTTFVALSAIAMMFAAAQFLFFSHGLWLTDTYDFDATQVGFAIVVGGGAEALASLATLRLTDLLGKRRSVLIGGVLMGTAMICFAVFPAPPLLAGLALLVLSFLGSEFAIVSSIPLISELEPDNRAAVIGLGTGLSTVARATVSLLAAWIYVTHGFRTMMVVAAIMLVASVVLLVVAVREPGYEMVKGRS